MKSITVLLLILIQVSCSNADLRVSRQHDGIDRQFIYYKNSFIKESKGKITEKDFDDLSMGFYEYPKDTYAVGTCWPMGYLTEIDISKKDWNRNIDHYWRKELVYHELGHCLLNRHHTDPTSSAGFFGAFEGLMFDLGFWEKKGYLSDGCPSSLMHSRMIGSYCFQIHHDYYIEELFVEYSPKYYFRNLQSQCSEAIILNKTTTWNELDQNTLDRAYKTCKKNYKSCLSKFTKTTETSYQAICGE